MYMYMIALMATGTKLEPRLTYTEDKSINQPFYGELHELVCSSLKLCRVHHIEKCRKTLLKGWGQLI